MSLKYTIFKKGLEQDKNAIKCPNCHAGKSFLRGNYTDRVYTCRKCLCQFGIEYENERLCNLDKPAKIYKII